MKNLEVKFEKLFGLMPDREKFELLLESAGEEKIESIFNYWLLCGGVNPPGDGKRFNPYGLIYKVASGWKI